MNLRLAVVSLLCCVLPALAAGPAGAAEIVTRDAKNVRLATDDQGRALVTYSQGGRMWHVFYSGAINARQPSPSISQVKFKVDYSGGRGQWKNVQEHVPVLRRPEARLLPHRLQGVRRLLLGAAGLAATAPERRLRPVDE